MPTRTVVPERRGEPLITSRVIGFRARLQASLARDNERGGMDREQINSTDCPGRDPIKLRIINRRGCDHSINSGQRGTMESCTPLAFKYRTYVSCHA